MADQDLPNLDKTITELPADIRQDLAERGRTNLFFFATAIMGYKDMTERCHKPLCEFLDYHPSLIKLVLMPRGHFKSSVATISRVTQKALRNPNERILLVNETTDNAENFLSAIEQNLMGNKILRALYSEVIPKDTRKVPWNNKEMRLIRDWQGPEETITAMGMTSAITSRHYTHITVDDPISEEAAKSDSVMADAISRISKFFSLMVKPKYNTLDLIGTRWALHDVYSHFMKKLGPQMARFVRSAILPDGSLLFPELIDQETLAAAREMYGEYMFSCLYMNNPRDVANQNFNVQDLRFWRWSTDEESVLLYGLNGEIIEDVPIERLDINVSVDLAVAEKITNDRNAVVTTGVTPSGRVVVLDTWVKRCTPLDVIERLLWINKRFHPRQVGIEAVAYQKAFKYFLRDECERRGVYMNIVELKAIPSKRGTGNNSKEMRIRGLQPVAATGRLYVLPTQHELRNELADFPLGEHDDCADALAHQLVMWRGLVSPERMARYKASEDRLIAAVSRGLDGVPIGSGAGEDLDPDEIGLHRFGHWEDYSMR
jgi:predicted phage terminase large subunit-like protein